MTQVRDVLLALSPFQSHLRDCVATEGPWTTEDKIEPSPALVVSPGASTQNLEIPPQGDLPYCSAMGNKEQTFSPGTSSLHCQHFQFHLPLTKCNFLFLKKKPKELCRNYRQSQEASWAANNSEQTTIWWVKCKRSQRHMDYIFGETHMGLQCKQGHGAGGVEKGMLGKMWFGSCQLQNIWNK